MVFTLMWEVLEMMNLSMADGIMKSTSQYKTPVHKCKKNVGLKAFFPEMPCGLSNLDKACVWVKRHNNNYFVGWTQEQLEAVDHTVRPLTIITPELYKRHMNRSEYCRIVKLKYCLESDADWAKDFRHRLSTKSNDGGFKSLGEAKLSATELWRKYSEHYDAQRARVCPPRQTLRKHYLTNFALHKMKKSRVSDAEKQTMSNRPRHLPCVQNPKSTTSEFSNLENGERIKNQIMAVTSPIIKHEISDEPFEENFTSSAAHEILKPMMDTLFPCMQYLDATVYEKVKILLERKNNNFFLDWRSDDLISVEAAVRPFRSVDQSAYQNYQLSEEGQITLTLAKIYGDFSPLARAFIEKMSLPPQEGGYDTWDQFKTDIFQLMHQYDARRSSKQCPVSTMNAYATESFQVTVNSSYSPDAVRDDKNLQFPTDRPCMVSSTMVPEFGDGQTTQSIQNKTGLMHTQKRLRPFENSEEARMDAISSNDLANSPDRPRENVEIKHSLDQNQEPCVNNVPSEYSQLHSSPAQSETVSTERRTSLNNETNVLKGNSLNFCRSDKINSLSSLNASSQEPQNTTILNTLMDPLLTHNPRQSYRNASLQNVAPVTPHVMKSESMQRAMWKMRDKIANSCLDNPVLSWHDRLRPHLPLIRDHLGETYTLPSTVPECMADLVLVTLHKGLQK
ncbi:hypothetical protein ScPMuIL_003736 [Solemya velum]